MYGRLEVPPITVRDTNVSSFGRFYRKRLILGSSLLDDLAFAKVL